MYGDPTVSQAFLIYRTDFMTMKGRSDKTIESYMNASKLLVRYFGDVPLSKITFTGVRDWQDWLFGWQSQDTVRGNIICLRVVLQYFGKKGCKVLNYEDIPVLEREKRTIKYLTEDELEEFILETKRPHRGYSEINRIRNYAILRLIAATGIRNSEVCRLNRDDIKNRQFTVIGKSKDPHISFIDPATEEAIDEYLALRTDRNPAMFISHISGNRINSKQLRDMFQGLCERSQKFKGVTPHTIRHSFATKMLDRKVDIRHLGELMGHQDLNTTRKYTHVTNPQLKEIYDTALGY